MRKEMNVTSIVGYLYHCFLVEVFVGFTQHIIGHDTTVLPANVQDTKSHLAKLTEIWSMSQDYGTFLLGKLILQTRMCSHPVGLDV